MSKDCKDVCPRKDDPNFDDLTKACKNFRVALVYGTPRNEQTGAELATPVCGSELVDDRLQPSMTAEDYLNTLLPMDALRRLYDEGKLPQQGV